MAQLPVALKDPWQPLPRDYVLETLAQLCGLSGQVKWELTDNVVYPRLSLLDSVSKKAVLSTHAKRSLLRGQAPIYDAPQWWEVLQIDVDADIAGSASLEEVQTLNPTLSAERALSLLIFVVSGEVETKLYDLVLFANLARPGSVELFGGDIYADNQYMLETKHLASWRFSEAADLAHREEWPNLESLAVSDVWRWGSVVEGLSLGFSDGPMGRALNALTHLCSMDASEPFELFWALMGLEAIYIRERGSVMEQLRQKVQILLGTPKVHKKRFNRMYELRSRLIHGQLDFSSAYSSVEGSKPDKFVTDLKEATDLATALLLATVQEHVKRNLRDLKFSYRVDGAP